MVTTIYFLVASVFIGVPMFALDLGVAKLSLYRFFLVLTAGLFIILMQRKDPRLKIERQRMSHLYVWMYVGWLVYAIVSGIWAQDTGGWLKTVFFIGCGVFSIVMINMFIRKEKEVKNLFYVIFSVMLLHNLIGWFEILTNIYPFANRDKLDQYNTFASDPLSRIPISSYTNQNDFATVLVAGAFIALVLYAVERSKPLKFLQGALFVSSAVLIVQTQSRANMLALLIGLGTMWLVKYDYLFVQIVTHTKLRRAAVFLTLFAAAIFFIIPITRNLIVGFLVDLQIERIDGISSNANRINLILNGFYYLGRTFGFGVGAGNIEHWMRNFSVYPIGTITNMHNWWMEILAGFGFVVFFAYVFVYAMMMIQLYRQYKVCDDTFIKRTSIRLIGLMSAFIFASMSSSSNMVVEWHWVVWGCIIAFIGYSEKRYSQQLFPKKSKPEMAAKYGV